MKKLGEMWGALDDAAKQRYKEDAPMVEVKPRKPRARSRTPPPPDEDLRQGNWTSEEKAYAEKLLELLQSGRLPEGPERPDDGVGCRAWLAGRLNCRSMRVTKKFADVDFRRIGSYVHQAGLMEDLEDEATELARLREAFLDAEPGRPTTVPQYRHDRSWAAAQGHATRRGDVLLASLWTPWVGLLEGLLGAAGD